MYIIRYLKGLGYCNLEQSRKGISSVKPFGKACDSLATCFGGRFGTMERSRHDELCCNRTLEACDRMKLQASNVKAMLKGWI